METAKFYIPDHDRSPNRPRPLYCCEPGDRDQSGEYVKAEDARALEAENARLKSVVESQAETIRLMAKKQATRSERAKERRKQLAELREAVDWFLECGSLGQSVNNYVRFLNRNAFKELQATLTLARNELKRLVDGAKWHPQRLTPDDAAGVEP
jgi:chromosome segregation ATPase